jgi:hypothetical protein
MVPRKIHSTFDRVDTVLEGTDKSFEPIRRSVFKRFPGFFTLVVTFGVGATFFGIERILATTPLFNEHPWYTFGIGVIILVLTGRLYAKLG